MSPDVRDIGLARAVILLALIGLGIHLIRCAHDTLTPSTIEMTASDSRRLYEVVWRDRLLGAAVCPGPENLSGILARLDCPTHRVRGNSLQMIPPNRVIRIASDGSVSFWERIHGGRLLCAGIPINANTASERDLTAIPGIGPWLAERIVDHRRRNGPFTRVDQITEVRGIKLKRLAAVKRFLTVRPPERAQSASIRRTPSQSPLSSIWNHTRAN